MGYYPHEGHRILFLQPKHIPVRVCAWIYSPPEYLPLWGPQDGKFYEGRQGCPFVWEDNRGTFGLVFHLPDIVVEDVGIFRY